MGENIDIVKLMKRRKLDAVIVCGEANLKSLIGYSCDNGVLVVSKNFTHRTFSPFTFSPFTFTFSFYTDFRYAPEARRKCRGLKVRDIKNFEISLAGRSAYNGGAAVRARRITSWRIGYEGEIPHRRFVEFQKFAKKAKFVDVSRDLLAIRAVKGEEEIAKLRAAEKLDCEIYRDAVKEFRAGMTERQMAAVIKKLMIERGDGEAFDTIVCIGRNAAECHHVPDDTVWNGRESVLIDMGVKLGGYCSDLTRNILPKRMSGSYRRAYELVKEAHDAAIAAAKPGLPGRKLDKIARDAIRKGGFGKCFGHSLGHGVGLEIHEAPNASKKSDWTLKPGMLVTIEPGIYLEDNFGIRIEDLILITETGCEVLST